MRFRFLGIHTLLAILVAPNALAGITLKEVRFPATLTGKNGTNTPPEQAPLSQRIVFHFSGKPKIGPGLPAGIRIEIDPSSGAGQTVGQLAFGSFEQSGNDLIWTPRLPSGDLPITFGPTTNLASNAALPGLLPATTYRIIVILDSPNSVLNLSKVAPSIPTPLTFTTVPVASGSDPFPSYFPNAVTTAPNVQKKQLLPAAGAKGVHPAPLLGPTGLFNSIPAAKRPPFRVRFDRAINPVASNLARVRLRVIAAPGGGVLDDVLETTRVVTQNTAKQATLLLYPVGVLPIGHTVALEISDFFGSLSGAVKNDGFTPESFSAITQYVVASDPSPGVPISGQIFEDFDTAAKQDLSVAAEGLQPAGWDSNDSNVLRASFGFGGDGALGRFQPPTASPLTITLDTDFQTFPLFSGSTPDAAPNTVVAGGVFNFTEFTLPANVTLVAVGSNPLIITATGNVLIQGFIDLSGKDGTEDGTFNSAVTPAPGGSPGAGGGKGGDGHPVTLPTGATSLLFMQTPQFGQTGFGAGNVPGLGGGGGQSGCTLPWSGFSNGTNCGNFNEAGDGSRGSGGGGGSYAVFLPLAPENTSVFVSGRAGGVGIGNQLPIPFSPALPFPPGTAQPYDGMSPNAVARQNPNPNFTEAVHQGLIFDQAPLFAVGGLPTSWANTHKVTFGGGAGVPVFADNNPNNNFIGPDGELKGIIGGQGGGGGGTRTEGLSLDCLPATFGTGFPLTVLDAKGAGAGGGGGALMIQALGTITLSGPSCKIVARGGNGKGGETTGGGGQGGNGGGGSGGAIVLQSAVNVVMTGLENYDTNPNNPTGVFRAIDVSGGCGFNSPILTGTTGGDASVLQVGDGGPGGPGLVQIQVPVGVTPTLQTDRIGARVHRGAFNITCATITGVNANYAGTSQTDPLVPMAKTPSPLTPVSVARSTWHDLGALTSEFRPLINTTAGPLAGPLFGVPGVGPFFRGTDPTSGLVKTDGQGFVLNPFSNDLEVDAPDLIVADFIPQGTSLETVTVRFEGADEDAANPGLPKLSTSTGFVTDPTLLNGKRFVRYEIRFNIAAAPGAIPQPTTPRPQVNFLRIPFQY